MDQVAVLGLENISETTLMGANLVPSGEGATFKVWAPVARDVRLRWEYKRDATGNWHYHKEAAMQRLDNGMWGGWVPGLQHGDRYMFYVVGPTGGTEGLKRDPYARDLSDEPMWPECQCLLQDPSRFHWHDAGYHPPPYHELIIYQFHIGTWYVPEDKYSGKFLDVLAKLPYLKALGINAIQPLPVVEFPTMFSLGYNGVDYFSPETDYGVQRNDPAIHQYLEIANQLLYEINPHFPPYQEEDIQGTANQLRMMIDLCHVYDIAVLLDVVYNHAGGDFGDRSIYFFDRQAYGDHNNSLYFTDRGWAGGLVFAYWKNEVKQFLIDNAKFYLQEYHVDGFRYDEVSVIKNEGGEHGWLFCQYVTDTCHYVRPEAIHIAEHWPVEEAIVRPTAAGGAGFDALQNDGLREAVRGAIGQAAGGAHSRVDMGRIARELASPVLRNAWRAVQCTENHDLVYRGRGPRIPSIADGSNSRSWYARSRSRVGLGLTLTAPGIPHLFMGQEFLEDKQWHDDPGGQFQIWWDGLTQDKSMADFLRFSQELMSTRKRLQGLRGAGLNVFHAHDENRVLAFHRWHPGQGHDVVIVASLNEFTFYHYRIGFPLEGAWREEFNSDVYDHWVNPQVAGNGGAIYASASAMHGLPFSAAITIPANSLLIFTK